MSKWQQALDQQVKQAIGDGDISHLPGAGKPLRLEKDCHTPDDMRLAQKIMADHDVLPDWLVRRQQLDRTESELREQTLRQAKQYLARSRQARESQQWEREAMLKTDWQRFKAKMIQKAERYNRDVLNHNLTAPKGMPRKALLNYQQIREQMLARALDAASGD